MKAWKKRKCCGCARLMEVLRFFLFQKTNLRFALPLLFLCALLFLDCGGGWAASLTASSQKPMLELWASPQMLLESEPQLVQGLVFTDPHTELLRGVCKQGTVTQCSSHNGKDQKIIRKNVKKNYC